MPQSENVSKIPEISEGANRVRALTLNETILFLQTCEFLWIYQSISEQWRINIEHSWARALQPNFLLGFLRNFGKHGWCPLLHVEGCPPSTVNPRFTPAETGWDCQESWIILLFLISTTLRNYSMLFSLNWFTSLDRSSLDHAVKWTNYTWSSSVN